MDFGMTTFNNASALSQVEKRSHGSDDLQHFLQTSKSSKTSYFDNPNKTMSLRSDSLLSMPPSDANNMLSFSSSSSANTTKEGNQTSIFSFYQPPPLYIRNTVAGYGYGGLQTGMQMPISRYKGGPFTPSQWMELEHQALIYKHFVANVPVPSNLLNPLRKSPNTFLFPGSSSSISYAPNSYGWGTFHLGFSRTSDPEPGRCRRTDGKKWRCSRDAVPDQKYCERHINRGRHRSRKPVESQNGQAVSGPTASKAGPIVSSSVPASSTHAPINRTQESQVMLFPANYTSFVDQGVSSPNPVPNFLEGWSKDEPVKPDWTRLSMSIPMACSDFSSSSNSPAQEKLQVPPLGLTGEFDHDPDPDPDPTHKQAANWIPISWGDSMGGPLGEVLNGTCSSSDMKCRKSPSGSETNRMTEMWDAGRYDSGSGCSPTGVLQKTTFVSLSNSSSGSPKGNKKEELGVSGSDQLVLSTLAS